MDLSVAQQELRTEERRAAARAEVMLVSASVSPRLRQEVAAGARPRPEYLALEEDFGVGLLDWSMTWRPPAHRSPGAGLRQVATALTRSRDARAYLSDSEHLGLPLAAAVALRPRARPGHVMIAHHMTTPAKRRLLRIPGVLSGVDAFVVHSTTHFDGLVEAGAPEESVHLVPYGVDTEFWSPRLSQPEEGNLVVSSGREHRDYATLAAALGPSDAQVIVADGSSHSPHALHRAPDQWPSNFARTSLRLDEVRDLYARAAVVVVPLVPTDFPAGITVVIEAMAMGKAVVVSATHGLRGAIADQAEAVVSVPAEDPRALREAVVDLLGDGVRRNRLGQRGRQTVEQHHAVPRMAAALHELMKESGARNG
jgi:glycosyltransferase involved in cell wall biosynthesis